MNDQYADNSGSAGESGVAIVYFGFVLGHGGDAIQMLELAHGMQQRGRRVRIVVPRIPTTEGLAADAAARGVELIRTPLMRADPVAPKQVPEDLIALFGQHSAPVLHFHTGDFCLSRTVPKVLGEIGIPPERVVVTVHSPYDTLAPGEERAKAWAAAAGTRIHKIICPSNQAVRTQLKYGVAEEHVCHIPNGVDVARFRNGDGAQIRSELNLPAKAALLVFTSRLDPQKRPLDALNAFIALAGEPEFRLLHIAFVGKGELESRILEAASAAGFAERVHLMGHRSDVPNWLAAATVWMLPTEAENFSLAVLEALAAGSPILSTRCRGNDEVLVSGTNAELHTVGNVPQLIQKLQMLLKSVEYRAFIAYNGIQTSHEYNVSIMVDRYAALYAELESEQQRAG